MSGSATYRQAAARALVALALAGALTGCASPRGVPAAPPTVATPTRGGGVPASGTTADRAGAIARDASAAANLPLFRTATERVWRSADRASGRAYIDALVRVGFAKSAMQVTRDRSTVGNPAESIQFSVHWHDGRCLVGQVGPATGQPVVRVLDDLPDGACLIGDTRPIDW